MMYGVDYDDAINVVDVWLHSHPEQALWERDDTPSFDDWMGDINWRPSTPLEMEEEDAVELLALSF